MDGKTETAAGISGGTPTIFVSNMDEAVRFYTEALGLKLAYRAGDHWASVDAGDGLTLGLHPATERAPAPGTPGSVQIGLNVTGPIEDVVAALKSRGVPFRGEIVDDAEGAIKLAFFTDPDGNVLYLCEEMGR
ncbi:MAG: VOC family protein [Armatimonadetes bacterium]|nr:VOC family protein [Armatimonadota bacterium]